MSFATACSPSGDQKGVEFRPIRFRSCRNPSEYCECVLLPFDGEMMVGGGGTDNRERPTVDYLMNFSDYSVLVEINDQTL